MRKLMWFAIGFCTACAVGIYFSFGTWLLLSAAFCLPCAVALLLFKSEKGRRAGLAVCGCFVCFLWLFAYDSMYLSHARAADGETVHLTVVLSDYGYDSAYGMIADGKTELNGKTFRIRLYLEEHDDLSPGDVIAGAFRLRYTAVGAEEESTYHQGKGIFLLGYSQQTPTVMQGDSASYFAPRLRKQITQMLDAVFPADVLGFARALLLGDSSLLTYEQDTAFQVSGIRHVIAVSGLHVSILFSLVYLLSGKKRGLTALIGIPVLVLFAAVAGFTPSINRACIMQVLMILALLLNREYDAPTALGFAVLVMLLVNPMSVTSVSFQLSVGCMIGIFLFAGRIQSYFMDEKRLGRFKGSKPITSLLRWIVGSVSVTLSAMATTTPLCAFYFGCISLVGIVTNLLTLWVVSFIFYGIMAACVAGVIWLPAAKGIAFCVALPIRYVLGVAATLSKIPLAAVYTNSAYVVAWLIFAYVLLSVFLFVKHKRPLIFALCMVLSLGIALGLNRLEVYLEDYRLTVLDVGHGQAIVMQTKEGCYLIDCGGTSPELAADTTAKYLLSMGIYRLDGVIVTHYDADHVAGLPLLLSRIPADRLYLPDTREENTVRTDLSEEYGDKIHWIASESVFSLNNGKITIFGGEKGKTSNESSLCVLFQPENCDILITGDRGTEAERFLLAQTVLPKLDVLVVGHHGSATSTSMELLKQTVPAVAIISAGETDRFDLPADETLKRLDIFGCKVLRTDQDGTIIIRR